MNRQLQIAKVYKVEQEYGGLCNDELYAFTGLINLFDIEIDYQRNDDSEYEIERAELEHLRDILSTQNKTYQQNSAEAEEILSEAGITREHMITALGVMISESDQDDSLVHIFCE